MSKKSKYESYSEQGVDQSTRISCEYCGTFIDITKDESCPGCGASYDKNTYLQQLQEQQKEIKRLHMEAARLDLAERKAALKRDEQRYEKETARKKPVRRVNKGCLIQLIVMMLVVFISFSVGVYNLLQEEMEDYRESKGSAAEYVEVQEEQIVETPKEVSFNESADMTGYSVICDKMEEYYYPWVDPQDGFYYVKLHLIVSNKGDEQVQVPREMVCQYIKGEYKMQAVQNTISSSDLGTKIYGKIASPDSSTEGWVYFEVPLEADLILKYNEYVTINISADNCVMLEYIGQ